MKRFRILSAEKFAVVALLSVALSVHPALAKSAVKMQRWSGTIDFSSEETATFALDGVASHLGKFTAYGELNLAPRDEEGIQRGEGVVVFKAANGDLLVGVISWVHDEEAQVGHFHHVSWRDSVQFNDGTVVSSTGRFIDDRPPGIVTVEYIALATFTFLLLIVSPVRD